MKKRNPALLTGAMILLALLGLLGLTVFPGVMPEKSVATVYKPSVTMSDALFIGDSRTLGLAEYADLDGADFFASVGMTARDTLDKTLSVANVGKLSLEELLKAKEYGKIYLMLGINELEDPARETAAGITDIIHLIRKEQSDAVVILMGNLHVTAVRSAEDPHYNNPAIDALNAEIARLADDQSIFYLDPNVLMDDESGALDPMKSADNAHLLAQCYHDWGVWLVEQTGPLLARAGGERQS